MPQFRPNVCIVGLGLIGGSLSLALSKRGIRVTGYDQNRAVAAKALRRRAISRSSGSIRDAVENADIVVVCVPVQMIASSVRKCLVHSKRGAVITDTGSVKAAIVRKIGLGPGRAEYIGGHPMAGTEKAGFDEASGDMFLNRVCILTPRPSVSSRALHMLRRMWSLAGARTLVMTPAEHDRLVARISHLPHVIAIALMDYSIRGKANLRIASGSFRDVTRVAASSPSMWQSIFEMNRKDLDRSITDFAAGLGNLRRAIRRGSRGSLGRILRKASNARIRLERMGLR